MARGVNIQILMDANIDITTPAADKLATIVAALAAGQTVYVVTMTRTTMVTPKFAAKWSRDLPERPLFKVSGTSLYMSSGKRYVCLDFTAIAIR